MTELLELLILLAIITGAAGIAFDKVVGSVENDQKGPPRL